MPVNIAAAPVAKPLNMAGQAAQGNWTAAQQQFGGMPGMGRFFQQPGSAANPLARPRATMHSGPGTPGLRQAYMQALAGGGSNAGNMGMPPGASLRDMRALYGGNPNIMDSSNLRFVAPLIGLQHIYSGQGSGY